MAEPVFAWEKIGLAYDGRRLFQDFSEAVAPGEKLVIEGKSGIGKSSLLRLLVGTAVPQAGRVRYHGSPLDRPAVCRVRREVALVGQEPDLGDQTVEVLLRTVLGYKVNRHLGWDEALLRQEMDWLELPPAILASAFPKLSGGEKQRVALLLALMLRRSTFLLDEVTAAVDKALKAKVIHRFLTHPEWTVVAVSHDPGWAEAGLARVLTLEAP